MAKTIVGALGVVFILAGIAGFIPGLTTEEGNVFGLFFVGEDSRVLHNMVHLLSGVAALAAVSSGYGTTRTYAQVFGVVYALVTLLGFITESGESILGILPINGADNVLHLAIAVALLYVGFGPREGAARNRSAAA